VALAVRVVSRGGRGVPEADVAWQLQGAGELLDGPLTRTAADGGAVQRLAAGAAPGISSVVASDPAGEREVVFTVTVGSPPGGR
jgi:hypothetical protein